MSAPAMAIRLAARGIPSFPCRPNKRPACPNGFYDSECEPDALHALWTRYPGELIGIPTGERSRISVLDLDFGKHPASYQWYEYNKTRIPETVTYATVSGGLHLLYRHSDEVRNSESRLHLGVDTRGTGGYIIYWPAAGCEVLRKGSLASWPSWISESLWPPSSPTKSICEPKTRLEAETADRVVAIASRVLFRLETAPDGQRHYRLRAAARTIGGLLHVLRWSESSTIEMLVDAAIRAGGRDRKNAEATAKWGLEKGKATPLTLAEASEEDEPR